MRGPAAWTKVSCAVLCWASVSAAAPGPGVQPAPAAKPLLPLGDNAPASAPPDDWTRRLSIGGGMAIYYYQPTNGWDPLYLIYTNLRFNAQWGRLGLHLESRLTNEKMRPFYDGLAFIQQGYLFFEEKPFTLKAGKIYKQLGLFWDKSFYGNIQVYEGLKLDPNAGFSLEGKLGKDNGGEVWLQYFVSDGHTNASLVGRDTISIPEARRRNISVMRIQPFFTLSPTARLEVGISAEHFTADLPSDEHKVGRAALDAKLSWGGFGMWGEVLRQWGKSVDGYPYPADDSSPGRASGHNTYLQAGLEYTLKMVTVRYAASVARYADVDVQEVLHLPAVEVAFNDNSSCYVEYASWKRNAPEGTSEVDASLNLTWMAHF